MENDRASEKPSQNTPKRPLEIDEVSPNSQQKEKEVKTMALKDAQFEEILNGLKSIQDDMREIKRENADFKKALLDMDVRVKNVEANVIEIKEKSIRDMREEIKTLRERIDRADQSQLSTKMVIRSFPREITTDRKHVIEVLGNIFNALEVDVNENDYDAFAYTPNGRSTSNIKIDFCSSKLKKKVLERFKQCRKSKDPQLLVEKLIGLPHDHELNGRMISMANQLTSHNMKLLEYARKFVPSHFHFAYDAPDGSIMVKNGDKMQKVKSSSDVDDLVSTIKIQKAKSSQKTGKNAAPTMVTRQNSSKSNKA